MLKNVRVTFRIDNNESEWIDTIAQQLQRNRSDAIRFVLREAARTMGIAAENATEGNDNGKDSHN